MHYLKDQSGKDIAGFSEEHQCVQRTDDPKRRKTFTRIEQAIAWAEDHVGCGFGLTAYTLEVVR